MCIQEYLLHLCPSIPSIISAVYYFVRMSKYKVQPLLRWAISAITIKQKDNYSIGTCKGVGMSEIWRREGRGEGRGEIENVCGVDN